MEWWAWGNCGEAQALIGDTGESGDSLNPRYNPPQDTCTTWMALAYHSMTACVLTRRIATGENARLTSIPEPADICAYRAPPGACTGHTPPTGPYTVLASPRKPGSVGSERPIPSSHSRADEVRVERRRQIRIRSLNQRRACCTPIPGGNTPTREVRSPGIRASY